ncbi:hypothetical protein [Shimia haliotis]|nr:hypothetical protein [Shimia haliotis]
MAVFAVALGCLSPAVAKADPSFGFGISYTFDGDVAFGVRVFSDDRAERGALSLGLDYKFRSKGWRPNVGAAYLDEDFFVDLSLGYDFNTQGLDFGAGLGLTSNVNAPGTAGATVVPSPGPGTDAGF